MLLTPISKNYKKDGIMIKLSEDFKKIIEKDKHIKMMWNEYQDAINKREEYFNKVVMELNNHRSILQEEYGLKGYNYSKPCEYEDTVRVDNSRYYCFKVIFTNRPSAKELGIIEDITGCKYVGGGYRISNGNSVVFYFELPEIVEYEVH